MSTGLIPDPFPDRSYPDPLASCPTCGSPDHLLDLARNVMSARPEHGICDHCGQWSPCTERRLAEGFLGLAYAALEEAR
jgi:hypothetical protein